jgi:hypothetical protein
VREKKVEIIIYIWKKRGGGSRRAMAQKSSSGAFVVFGPAILAIFCVQLHLTFSALVNDKHFRSNGKLLNLDDNSVKSYTEHPVSILKCKIGDGSVFFLLLRKGNILVISVANL